jgi:hypothetical protein
MSDFIADDLKNMYLNLERIQKVWWSSSVPHTKIHDECVIALTNMWLENHPVNPKRFGTFINKCKELWMMEKQEYKLQVKPELVCKADYIDELPNQHIPILHQKHVRRRWFQNDTPSDIPLSLNLWTSKKEMNIPKVNILSKNSQLKLNPKEKNERDKLSHINYKIPHPPLKAKPSSNNIISRRRQFRF